MEIYKKKGHGWKLNQTNSYYQEGWLAAGNNRSVVGVTFTSTLPHRNSGLGVNPPTDNEISGSLPLPAASTGSSAPSTASAHELQPPWTSGPVRWDEPYQKLAKCDASGIIFVWIRYEGRWSIELINDRNTPDCDGNNVK